MIALVATNATLLMGPKVAVGGLFTRMFTGLEVVVPELLSVATAVRLCVPIDALFHTQFQPPAALVSVPSRLPSP